VDHSGRAVTYNGSTWSAPVRIDASGGLASVSCPSTSFCAAVDWFGDILTYDGTSWGLPQTVEAGLESVSCPSASFCVAVDKEGNALTYNGSTWSAPVSIDGTNSLTSVSCPSASFCVAVDEYGNAIAYDGSSWGLPTHIDGFPYVRYLTSVSCPTASFCVAVDYGGNVLTYQESPSSSSMPGDQVQQSQEPVKAHAGQAEVRGLAAWVPLECTGPSDAVCKIGLAMRFDQMPKPGKSRARVSRRAALVGGKTALLGSGDAKVVRVKLNAMGRSLLMLHGKLSASLIATQTTNSSAAVISSQGLTFKHRKRK
jgi:hypothetical protein